MVVVTVDGEPIAVGEVRVGESARGSEGKYRLKGGGYQHGCDRFYINKRLVTFSPIRSFVLIVYSRIQVFQNLCCGDFPKELF